MSLVEARKRVRDPVGGLKVISINLIPFAIHPNLSWAEFCPHTPAACSYSILEPFGKILLSIISSMSKQGKKGGGKRPREPKAPPDEEPSPQSVAPSISSPRPSSAYSSTGFNDVYQPSLQRSGGLGSQIPQVSMHSSQPLSFTGKVAIPALRTPQPSDSKSFRKGRTQHACDACRKAKSGCSGGNPCSRCKTMKSICVYGDGKREKEKKYVHYVHMWMQVSSLTSYTGK